jgi:hypothetical protein
MASRADGTRTDVLAYASQHGDQAASDRYGTPKGTIWSWRSRARKRAAALGTDPPPPTPADRWQAEARQTADRYLRRVCLRCEGSHRVRLPEVRRGSLVIRKARVIDCPDCGAPLRRITVTEWPQREWTEAMARAGDAGLGWSGAEWARIRSGEPDPDGQRFTGRGDG